MEFPDWHPRFPLAEPYVIDRELLGEPVKLAIRTNEGVAWYDPPHLRGVVEFGIAELIHCRDLGLLRPGATVVDLGAHHGVLSTWFATAVGPAGRVLAVEPVEENIEIIRENARLNGLDNLMAIHAAIGAEAGTAVFDFDTGAVGAGGAARERRVPVRTLDDIAAGTTPGLLKIDVEGFEGAALRGGPVTLAARPNLMIELHPQFSAERYNDPVDRVVELVDWSAYDTWILREQGGYMPEPWTGVEQVAPGTMTAWLLARAR